MQFEFPITVYGQTEKVNDVLVKARCRIFYKGLNRNGTFITDEFADELVSTLHYVPVKGIYEDNDFKDHGKASSEGRIYGVVPETNNFAWEPFVDEDGVERVYACSDVLLFSALYPETKEIAGKAQSMELYPPSLKYHRDIVNGAPCIVFEHGSFLGLQVLGEDVEPCFEGASFFSLQSAIENAVQKIKEHYKMGGSSEMPKINFKLSDDQKFQAIWSLLNTEYDEEHNWTVTYGIAAIYDEYALVINYETGEYARVAYTKNDENDSVELGEMTTVYIIDVTEQEKATVETLRRLNGDTYELVNENLTNAEENAAKCAKIEEMTSQISTLEQEIASTKNSLEEKETAYQALSKEHEELAAYKKAIETEQKESVIAEYDGKLSEEMLESYRAKIDDYTTEDLDMRLAYELKKANPAVFSKTEEKGAVVPKDDGMSGVDKILSRYKK